MSERNVLAACMNSRRAFDKVHKHINKDDFGEQGKMVLSGIEEYYTTDPDAECADPVIVANYIARTVSNPKHRDMFKDICVGMIDVEVSPANVVRDLIAVKQEAVGAKLASALTSGKPTAEVGTLMQQYDMYTAAERLDEEEEDAVVTGASIGDLVRTNYTEEGLQFNIN